MRYFVIFLVLASFVAVIQPIFGECISLPCNDANIKLGEPSYRFIDFSYANKVGEPITFILEKTAKNQCNSYIATITDENGNVVWTQQRGSLCVVTDDTLQTSQIKLGFDVHNPIVMSKSSKYLLKIEIDGGSIERDFIARYNFVGGTLDSTAYPINWNNSPLQQLQSGIQSNEIQCKDDLILIQKYDDSPACVKSETFSKLVKRGWSDVALPISKSDSIIIIPLGSASPEHPSPIIPKEITVVLGKNNTVTWINQDGAPSTLNSDHAKWSTGIILPKHSASITFNQTGVYSYHGQPHPWKSGKIIVLSDSKHESENASLSESVLDKKQTIFVGNVTEIVNPEFEPLKYKTTIPVIDKTYLSKNIQQWNNAERHDLESGYQYYGDDFYTELGRLLMKNEMQYQMNTLGIVNANDDFQVFSGMTLTSLPPHIGFSSVVYATDGHYYRLEGDTFANQVSYYRTTQLQFPDTSDSLPMESILSKPHLITIIPEDDNKARQNPSTLVIHVDDNEVKFFNNTPDIIRIQDHGSGRIGEEDTLDWIGPTILPFQNATMTFDEPGLVQWDARKAPNLENPLWWQTHGYGNIVVLSDDMDTFSNDDKARIAQKMLHNSDIPITASGAGNAEKVLKISLDPAVVAMIPDAEQYYLKRAHQLVPFDVEIVMDE